MSSNDYGGGLEQVASLERRHPAPGAEVVGPALTDLVVATKALHETMLRTLAGARADLAFEVQEFQAVGQLDSNGDALLELVTVPASSIGYLTLCCVDEATVTPSSPDTNADLALSIHRGAGPGQTAAANVVAVGSMLDCSPASVIANAQIPFPFVYGDYRTAPTIRGPGTFYLFVDGATASRQVAARGVALLRRLDTR